MQAYDRNPIEEQRKKECAEKVDKFWNAFQITENGKVKSTLLLNSFCMSVVVVAIYAVAFGLLLGPLETLTSGAPGWIGNLVGALVPAVVGSVVSLATFPLFKEKRTLPCTFLWILLFAVACLITMLILLWGETGAIVLLLQFYALFIPAPVCLGGAGALLLYRRWMMDHPRPTEIETTK